jgi:chromosome segregation ATPase
MSGAVTEDLLTPSSEDRNAHELVGNVGEEHNHPHQQQPPSVSEARESELRLPSIKHQEGDSTATTRRTRKSRFSSLSSEVDDAISIIYRELDSVQSLRKEIEQLSEEKERLMQGIKIRDHDILYLNRQLESRPPDAEVRRLKDDVKRFDGVVRDLREENASLKTNLRAAEESAAAANQTLNEWKKRLATLMQ